MREITLLDDTHLYLHDEGEALSDHIVRENDYFEPDILFYLSDKHPQHEIILDVGANIGNHTVYFSQYLEYNNIIAYEPVLDNFILLRQNVARYPNVAIRRQAVGAERKMVNIAVNRGNMGACEINPEGAEVAQQVRIDDLLIRERVTLIKIDVEWYEPQVLAGAKAIIEEDRPLILIEDVKREYTQLFEEMDYELEVAWPDHKTYLYRSKNA